MSLLQHHMMTRQRIAPTLVRKQTEINLNQDTPYTYVITVPVLAGSLMVIFLGGAQNRTFAISGFTRVLQTGISGGTLQFWYKFAVGGETSIPITWTGGTFQGQLVLYELSGVRVVNPLAYGGTGVDGGTGASKAFAVHNIAGGVFAFEQAQVDSAQAPYTISDGYTIASPFGRGLSAYKRYQAAQNGVQAVWASAGGSTTWSLGICGFYGIDH